MSLPRTATIRHTRWKLRGLAGVRQGRLGECDYQRQTIRAPWAGDTLDELDVIVHEAMHAGLPDIIDDAIDETATGLARLLWRLGWRREG